MPCGGPVGRIDSLPSHWERGRISRLPLISAELEQVTRQGPQSHRIFAGSLFANSETICSGDGWGFMQPRVGPVAVALRREHGETVYFY